MSDYLFIGSGEEDLSSLEEIASNTQIRSIDDAYRVASRLRGLGLVKGFYSELNPLTGKIQPAVPGSSLKGAVRSRIELATRGNKDGDKVVANLLYRSPGLRGLPPVGQHGWRHARIWCESIFENRIQNTVPSVLEDLLGLASRDLSLQSRVFFGTLHPVRANVVCQEIKLDHGETLCAVKRGTVFQGPLLAHNVSIEELGLLFYGLGLDKMLCGKKPCILMGYSKYRCRHINGEPVILGVVSISVESIKSDPLTRNKWLELLHERGLGEGNVQDIVRIALEEVFKRYPGLPQCFDEVERRFLVEPCGQGYKICT